MPKHIATADAMASRCDGEPRGTRCPRASADRGLAWMLRQQGMLTVRFPAFSLVRMSESTSLPALPDRLCVDPRSPYHLAAVLEHDIGIRFNDVERRDVEEYCVSEGWIRVAAGRSLDRKGRPLTIKLKGRVEAFYR